MNLKSQMFLIIRTEESKGLPRRESYLKIVNKKNTLHA